MTLCAASHSNAFLFDLLYRSVFPPLSFLFFPFVSHCHSALCFLALSPIGVKISSCYTLSICF